jgi:hypothetical protein
MKNQTTFILCGPQAAGKTLHAAQIAAGLGCSQIIDDWNGTAPLPPGALAITNGDYVIPPGGVVLHVEDRAGMANLIKLLSETTLNTEPPDQSVEMKTIRSPFSTDFHACSCGAKDKDNCSCIRETMRSNIASATSGDALSSNTDYADSQATSSVSVTNTDASSTADGMPLLAFR